MKISHKHYLSWIFRIIHGHEDGTYPVDGYLIKFEIKYARDFSAEIWIRKGVTHRGRTVNLDLKKKPKHDFPSSEQLIETGKLLGMTTMVSWGGSANENSRKGYHTSSLGTLGRSMPCTILVRVPQPTYHGALPL